MWIDLYLGIWLVGAWVGGGRGVEGGVTHKYFVVFVVVFVFVVVVLFLNKIKLRERAVSYTHLTLPTRSTV